MPRSVIVVVSLLLVAGALPLPYGFYQLLRVVACATFAWAALTAWRRGHETPAWAFAIAALLFNPLVKVPLGRELWMVVDVAAGLGLWLSRRWIAA